MKWKNDRSAREPDGVPEDFTVQYDDDFGTPRDGEIYGEEPAYRDNYDNGYNAQYDDGYDDRYDNYDDRYDDGYGDGYQDSYSDDGYNDNYNGGYDDGYDNSYDNGYGYDDYSDGYDDGVGQESGQMEENIPYKKGRKKASDDFSGKPRRKKKKRGCLLKLLIQLIVLLIIVIVGFFAFLFFRLDPVDFPTSDSELGITADASDSGVINIALFGVDARDYSENTRSDAIMIMSVDTTSGRITLSSLMRDTLVSVPGYWDMKLTESYAYGGPELAVQTINANFGTDIREYATVTFKGMAEIIDAAGGVMVDISEEERVSANGSIWEQWDACGMEEDYIGEAGYQRLSGTQAVAYARIRYVGNADYQRTSRQRIVLTALFKQMLTHPQKIPQTLMTAEDVVETSLSQTDVLSLMPVLLHGPKLESTRFPLNEDIISDSYYVGNAACIYADMDSTRSALHDFIYNGIDPTTDSDRRSNGELN